MELNIYQIDAFTSEIFKGNPAAVILLEKWIGDDILQNIAQENNLSETAFIVKNTNGFDIRWFTPTMEVDLCGHATLAAAYVVKEYYNYKKPELTFSSKSGDLEVLFENDLISLIFPSRPPSKCETPKQLVQGLQIEPKKVLKSRDYLVELNNEKEVQTLRPNIDLLRLQDCIGIIVTAKGNDVDFVSRFFAPNAGIPEDPVTGSAHCTLIPYWSKELGKKEFVARQLSKRGGELYCLDLGGKVKISGKAVTYLEGRIRI